RGSTFTLRLPAEIPHAGTGPEPAPPAPPPALVGRGFEAEVEDEAVPSGPGSARTLG
ncbi:MAG: hypothetical protein QOE66_2268, partial [Chloroflexota bacterium]|nr:hypothetical protein [Chloroflexota bacterium]